eukprot:1146506-Pelagomonas_calceolata.AAC.2
MERGQDRKGLLGWRETYEGWREVHEGGLAGEGKGREAWHEFATRHDQLNKLDPQHFALWALI